MILKVVEPQAEPQEKTRSRMWSSATRMQCHNCVVLLSQEFGRHWAPEKKVTWLES
jgi:hypothetical protein